MAPAVLYVLDTDMLSLYQRGHPSVVRAVGAHPPDVLAITIITVEEQLSGWYTLLRRAKGRERIAVAYQSPADNIRFLAGLQILPFSEPAILRFEQLCTLKLNVKAMDLRIAAVTLEFGGVLITRNQRDFNRVPDLSVQDWST